MIRLAVLISVFLLASVAVLAQKDSPAYAGTWNLDVEKSELGRRPIKSMKMTVTQTDTELSYQRKAEFDENAGQGFGRRGLRGGMGGEQAFTYDLTGRETTAPVTRGRGGSAKLSASMKDGVLKLTQTREFEGRMGAMTITMVETWSLSEDGTQLTVASETETPRGTRSSKMVFVKLEEIGLDK